MNVILLEKVANLGNLGDQVKVKAGYGRNFLVPSGKAVPATKGNIEYFEQRRAELEGKAKEEMTAAEKRRDDLDGKTITILAKAGDEGKLFGSVSNAEIAEAFSKEGVAIEKRDIRMPDGAIRVIGEYEFAVHLHTDIEAKIKVSIEAE